MIKCELTKIYYTHNEIIDQFYWGGQWVKDLYDEAIKDGWISIPYSPLVFAHDEQYANMLDIIWHEEIITSSRFIQICADQDFLEWEALVLYSTFGRIEAAKKWEELAQKNYI